MSFFGSKKPATLKTKKGPSQSNLKQYAESTLGINFPLAVQLPEGEDLNEWLAVNLVDFYSQINLLYGTLTEFCTKESCPVMSAGPKFEYHWADSVSVKKPLKCSAPEYVQFLMKWIQSQIDDENIFPSKLGQAFPKNFKDLVKNMFRRLFRVYAHIYHHHFGKVVTLKLELHLNTSFKHFIRFANEFNLIQKTELNPVQEVITQLLDEKK